MSAASATPSARRSEAWASRDESSTPRVSVRAAVDTLGSGAEPVGEAAAVEPQGPAAKSQTALVTLFTQLVPLAVLPTVLRVGQFALWMVLWWYLGVALGQRGIWVMFAALAAAGAARNTLAPPGAIALTWVPGD